MRGSGKRLCGRRQKSWGRRPRGRREARGSKRDARQQESPPMQVP